MYDVPYRVIPYLLFIIYNYYYKIMMVITAAVYVLLYFDTPILYCKSNSSFFCDLRNIIQAPCLYKITRKTLFLIFCFTIYSLLHNYCWALICITKSINIFLKICGYTAKLARYAICGKICW